MQKHYRQTNGQFHETLPDFHWLSPVSKVSLTEQTAAQYGYEPAENYPQEYGRWLIESGGFLKQVNDDYDAFCKAQIAKYSETERLTWVDQEREALAHLVDNNASTPTLDTLCFHRGFDAAGKLALANRIIANAAMMRALANNGLGIVQAVDDAVQALDLKTVTHEDVLLLKPNFENLLA